MLSDNHCPEWSLGLAGASKRHPVDHTWDLATALDDNAFCCCGGVFEDVGDGPSGEFLFGTNVDLPFGRSELNRYGCISNIIT